MTCQLFVEAAVRHDLSFTYMTPGGASAYCNSVIDYDLPA